MRHHKEKKEDEPSMQGLAPADSSNSIAPRLPVLAAKWRGVSPELLNVDKGLRWETMDGRFEEEVPYLLFASSSAPFSINHRAQDSRPWKQAC